MSLLQRTDVYQKADHRHPAFRPSGAMNSGVSEVTGTGENVRIHNVPTKYVDSEKWCGDERTKYAVLKVEATSFALAVICVAIALVLVSIMFPHEFSLIGF